MATEKLYYQDAHQAAFEARVVSCQPGKHGYDVVLGRTCFYPEGGGQPGDTGFLSGVRVTDKVCDCLLVHTAVQKRGHIIVT